MGVNHDGWVFDCVLHNWRGYVPCPDCDKPLLKITEDDPCPVQAQIEGAPLHRAGGEIKLTEEQEKGNPLRVTIGGKVAEDQAAALTVFKAALQKPLPANERQVAGNHYGKITYQHWDFAVDVDLSYLIGCASKYVTRWRDKNGVQDLEKALHYLQKAEETDVLAMEGDRGDLAALKRFTAQLPELESRAVVAMCSNEYEEAARIIADLILTA